MAATLILRETTAGLGGAPTSTEVSNTPMNNIWDDISPDQATAGLTEYRAVDIYNSGDAIAGSATVYISSQTSSTDTAVHIGIEGADINSTTSIAAESIAPVGVSFTEHLVGSQLSISNIPAGSYSRIWLKRISDAGATNTLEDIGTIAFIFA